MRITFIAHSAFLIEMEHCNLLFDWTGEMPLPAFDRSKPLYVFASHHHGDHYTPKIFSLGMENVIYVLATCIRLSAKRKAGLGIDGSKVYRLRAGITQRVGDLEVTTVRSNDAGVAFVVRTEEGSFFHAGDLNDWYWAEEAEEWNEMIKSGFLKSLAALQGIKVDAAFLPLDGRLGEAFYWGFHQFMETIECKKAFPMHCWGDFSVVERLKQLPESKPYCSRVADILKEEQVFYL